MSNVLKYLNLFMIILGFVWLIFAFKFSGINRDNMTSMWFSDLFRGTIFMVFIFLVLLILVSLLGKKISEAQAPSNLKVMFYGFCVLFFVMLPMFIIGSNVGELQELSKKDINEICTI